MIASKPTFLPAAVPSKNIGLEPWMMRVLDLCPKVRSDWNVDKIHDLRVSIRRSRAIAEALQEVNPTPGWKKIRKSSRELFDVLGDLRDTQVEKRWIKKLGPQNDAIGKDMLRMLTQRERKLRRRAARELEKFDRKNWLRWSHKFSSQASFFPSGSVVYQRLALSRLNNAADLYRQAREKRTAVSWHQLRIALKRFRYIVENFLPQRYEIWAEDLKAMQDLLGDVHDLDVLGAEFRNQAPRDRAKRRKWVAKIRTERQERIRAFAAKASAKDSPWIVWRAGLGWGHTLVAIAGRRRTA